MFPPAVFYPWKIRVLTVIFEFKDKMKRFLHDTDLEWRLSVMHIVS